MGKGNAPAPLVAATDKLLTQDVQAETLPAVGASAPTSPPAPTLESLEPGDHGVLANPVLSHSGDGSNSLQPVADPLSERARQQEFSPLAPTGENSPKSAVPSGQKSMTEQPRIVTGENSSDTKFSTRIDQAQVSSVNPVVPFSGKKSPKRIFTGEDSSSPKPQIIQGDGISTGGNSGISTGEKKGRGRPRGNSNEKPYAPPYYEWRGDSGGWKLIYRPPGKKGKRGYEYVGFLTPKRLAFFRRYNDEQFIKKITELFEGRKTARSVRNRGLRLVGG